MVLIATIFYILLVPCIYSPQEVKSRGKNEGHVSKTKVMA